ncbi:MAG: hypothetical protein U0353_27920 [Sandaracinus sp.]
MLARGGGCEVSIALLLGSMGLAACGRVGFDVRDADVAIDAPGLDAPGLDAPGLDAPGLDAPGLDAPGLDAPAPDSGTDAAPCTLVASSCRTGEAASLEACECVPAQPAGGLSTYLGRTSYTRAISVSAGRGAFVAGWAPGVATLTRHDPTTGARVAATDLALEAVTRGYAVAAGTSYVALGGMVELNGGFIATYPLDFAAGAAPRATIRVEPRAQLYVGTAGRGFLVFAGHVQGEAGAVRDGTGAVLQSLEASPRGAQRPIVVVLDDATGGFRVATVLEGISGSACESRDIALGPDGVLWVTGLGTLVRPIDGAEIPGPWLARLDPVSGILLTLSPIAVATTGRAMSLAVVAGRVLAAFVDADATRWRVGTLGPDGVWSELTLRGVIDGFLDSEPCLTPTTRGFAIAARVPDTSDGAGWRLSSFRDDGAQRWTTTVRWSGTVASDFDPNLANCLGDDGASGWFTFLGPSSGAAARFEDGMMSTSGGANITGYFTP